MSSPSPTPEPAKVIAVFSQGPRLCGYVFDFLPSREVCQISPPEAPFAKEGQLIDVRQLKGMFFVKEFGDLEPLDAPEFGGVVHGRKIEVIFIDDEHLIGTTEGYDPHRLGFFVIPAKNTGNVLRVFVVLANVKQVRRPTVQPAPEAIRRRSLRTEGEIPVRVAWIDQTRQSCSQTGVTRIFNSHGALLVLGRPLPLGTELEVTNVTTQVAAKAQVVCAMNPSQSSDAQIAIEFQNPDANFWTAESPT